MTHHRKRTIGDAIVSSSQYARDVHDGARWGREVYFGNTGPLPPDPSPIYQPSGEEIKIENFTNINVPMFGILGVEQNISVSYEQNPWEFLQNYTLVGTDPVRRIHKSNFVIVSAPLGSPTQGDPRPVGKCVVTGTMPVLVNILDVDHKFAAIMANENAPIETRVRQLESHASEGMPIVYSPRVTGVQWCIIRLTGSGGSAEADTQATHIKFTLNEDLAITANEAEATVTARYNGVTPAVNDTVTVHNTCNDFGGVAGTCGVAVWNSVENRYEINVLWEKYARFIEFEVTQDFNKADNFFNVTQGAFWDGVAPSPPVTQVVNTGNMWKGYAGWKGIARYDYYDAEYQAVFVQPNWALRVIEFKTREDSTPFLPTDAGPHNVDVTAHWNGQHPGTTVGVMNTGGIFLAYEKDMQGVAFEQEDGTWQIVQLKCDPPASQSVFTSTQTAPALPSYSGTATVLPFAAFEHSAGNLITINAQNEIELARDARGALRLEIGANWDRQSGIDATDTSIIRFQVDFGQGAGWEEITFAKLMFTHVYQRIPPTNYIMGGTASRSYWTQVIWPAGTKVRVTAETLNGTSITSMDDFSLEIVESYDTPLGEGSF